MSKGLEAETVSAVSLQASLSLFPQEIGSLKNPIPLPSSRAGDPRSSVVLCPQIFQRLPRIWGPAGPDPSPVVTGGPSPVGARSLPQRLSLSAS